MLLNCVAWPFNNGLQNTTFPSHTASHQLSSVLITECNHGYIDQCLWNPSGRILGIKQWVWVECQVELQCRNSLKKTLYEWAKVMDAEETEKGPRLLEEVGPFCRCSRFGLQPPRAAEQQIEVAANISGCVLYYALCMYAAAKCKSFQRGNSLFIFLNWPLIHTLCLLCCSLSSTS